MVAGNQSSPAAPGVFFSGYWSGVCGPMRRMRLEAKRIARAVKRSRRDGPQGAVVRRLSVEAEWPHRQPRLRRSDRQCDMTDRRGRTVPDATDDVDLPVPDDDGAADHLPGRAIPPIELPASDGSRIRLHELSVRSAVFVYPSIGGPGTEDLLAEWTAIPGARGCTPEACSFRDTMAGFRAAGVEVFGLSSQSAARQRDHVDELQLPFRLLSDEKLQLADGLRLPTFSFHGVRYFRRLTLIIGSGVVEASLYPVFPPDQGAWQALRWIEHTHVLPRPKA